ncbi:hypothetical protein [Phyllobacterium leguminum]|uniref:3-hydroxymyristoyl/3-hydroxydecanoyl-(Acyl carrier protein) dehydratase n=1 Tax=Phyllobacterium leguminum TaxID=314237 RepID=A0A318T7J3_9HYPH|nr:hypothetical protein [Phyllobacterium leguminum]PYE86488.1 hypothetical protein C7477_12432 [Phyllobacterium leguminum]
MTMEIMRASSAPVDIAGQIFQYDYFTDHFRDETFSFREFLIDAESVSCIVDLDSYEPTNVSLLLLDRILQSLGFAVSAYILQQQGRQFKFLFIKGIRWNFAGPIRPGRPVRLQSTYDMQFLSPRKAVCTFDGTVNDGKAAFNVAIEIFSPHEAPWDIETSPIPASN